LQTVIFDIIKRELEIDNRLIKKEGSVLFNFHRDMSLKYNYMLARNEGDDSQLYKRLNELPVMKEQLERHIRYFI